MYSLSNDKKILWLVEHRDLELDLIRCLSNQLSNRRIHVVSIRYWLFWPNLFKYKTIIIPFLPSYPSAHCSLIEESLKNGVSVIVLNWWQSLSKAEMDYRKKSLKYFSDYSLYVCSWNDEYTRYLIELGYGDRVIKCTYHTNIILKTLPISSCEEKVEKTVFVPINLGIAYANKALIGYRIKTGYNENNIYKHVEYFKRFIKKFAEDIVEFSSHNSNTKVVITGYPASNLPDFCKELETIMDTGPNNISFDFQCETARRLLECDLLITNIPDMCKSKTSIGGYSFVYRPLTIPINLEEVGFDELPSVGRLNFNVVDMMVQMASKDYAPESGHMHNLDFYFLINKITENDRSSGLSSRIGFSYSRHRFRVMLYNLKQQLLRIVGRYRSSEGEYTHDYFIPFWTNKIN
jgi:hypothetical protein